MLLSFCDCIIGILLNVEMNFLFILPSHQKKKKGKTRWNKLIVLLFTKWRSSLEGGMFTATFWGCAMFNLVGFVSGLQAGTELTSLPQWQVQAPVGTGCEGWVSQQCVPTSSARKSTDSLSELVLVTSGHGKTVEGWLLPDAPGKQAIKELLWPKLS